MNTLTPYDLIIGLDRSDQKADLCLINTHSIRKLASACASNNPPST